MNPAQPRTPPLPPFQPFGEVLERLGDEPFARLATFVARHGSALRLSAEELLDLDLHVEDLHAALGAAAANVVTPEIFDSFEGCWLGGDLHDVARSYRHRWYPTERQGRWSVQPVLMRALSDSDELTVAYNAVDPDDAHPIRGVVDGRPYLGFTIPEATGALLWVGAETGGNISIHAERVLAEGRLYEIRGCVVNVEDEASDPVDICASDWRYHRVDDAGCPEP